jgi:hypothetical protein
MRAMKVRYSFFIKNMVSSLGNMVIRAMMAFFYMYEGRCFMYEWVYAFVTCIGTGFFFIHLELPALVKAEMVWDISGGVGWL